MKLTNREREVVELVSQGMHNPDIGRRLGISCGSVTQYLHKVFIKTGKSNRVAVAMWWLKGGKDEQDFVVASPATN